MKDIIDICFLKNEEMKTCFMVSEFLSLNEWAKKI